MLEFIPESDRRSIRSHIKYLKKKSLYHEIVPYLAICLKRFSDSENAPESLKTINRRFYDGGDWETIKKPIQSYIQELLISLKLPTKIEIEKRPYYMDWHIAEKYMRLDY